MGQVDREDIDCRPADRCEPDEHGAAPLEVLLPPVASGVEQARNFPAFLVHACNVGSLVVVAGEASERQVPQLAGSVVFEGDDVIDLKRQQIEALRDTAVFTVVLGALPNTFDERWIHSSLGLWRFFLNGNAGLGLKDGEEVADALIGVDFDLLLVGEGTFPGFLRQFVHAHPVVIREIGRQDHLGQGRRKIRLRRRKHARKDVRLMVTDGGTHN